jgi:hypothetical protein
VRRNGAQLGRAGNGPIPARFPLRETPSAQPAQRTGAFRRWLQVYRVATLNVAGPRESESPGVYASAHALLHTLLAGPLAQ